MKIDLNNYLEKDFECPECHWKGKGKELDIENFSEQYEHFLSQLERLVIQYSFGKTQKIKAQSFENIESIFERPYSGLCDIA